MLIYKLLKWLLIKLKIEQFNQIIKSKRLISINIFYWHFYFIHKKFIKAINMPPIDVKMIQLMLISAVVILGIYILIINSIAYVQ